MLNFLAESDTKQRHDLTDLTSSLASSLPLRAVLSQLKAAEFRVKNLGSRYKNNLYKPEKTNVGFYSFFNFYCVI